MTGMKTFLLLGLVIVVALLGTACGSTQAPEAQAPEAQAPPDTSGEESSPVMDVTVSILPQKYFVERIGGDHVEVNVMVEPGASPATYEPKAGQLISLSASSAYFAIGVPFENAWLDKIASANTDMLMVDTVKGIERMSMTGSFDHEEGEKHETGGESDSPDPHIWLSPSLVKIQANNIYDALVSLDPSNQEDYRANLDSFLNDIDQLDADIRATLAGTESRKFIVFHPAWGYFARDYDLEMVPIEVGGQEPSAAELADLVTLAKEEQIQVIFAQPEFSTRDAETIADEIGGKVLLISPLAPDWLENLQSVSKTFAEVLGE
jgi:zinc transport system substrate-binding protein